MISPSTCPLKPEIWLWTIVLVSIWLPVVYLLGAQWSLFPAYGYGWSVPVLCLYLAGRRYATRPATAVPRNQGLALTALILGGLLFWGMRGLQEADPLWRLASYGLVLAALAMTGALIYLHGGAARLRHFAFPVAFFLVAVPWPTPVETSIIQTLSRTNAGVVAETLNGFGVPAVAQGNVIEVATGTVGIAEACSGIRSFQAALMLALFFGEYFRLPPGRRWLLLGTGPLLAVGFNLLRTLVLVLIAARAGLPAMEHWHDVTGVILLLACFLGIWWAANCLQCRRRNGVGGEPPPAGGTAATDHSPPALRFSRWTLAVAVWAVIVEGSTEAWFRGHENRNDHALTWVAKWPVGNSGLRTNLIPVGSLQQLRCDFNTSAAWTEPDGTFWQAFFLRWEPASSFYGRAKVAMSKSHNPLICLSAAGMKLETQLPAVTVTVTPDLDLAFDRMVFADHGRTLYVFFSQTEPLANRGPANLRMTPGDRLRAAWSGSRSYGQINFEAALLGPASPAAALKVFSATLPHLLHTDKAALSP